MSSLDQPQWDDERAVTILKHCHRAMRENGKLLLIEAVIPRGNTPFLHKFMDLTMLVIAGGRERTEAEYRALLAAASFRLTQIISTQSEMSVIEAVRAKPCVRSEKKEIGYPAIR
jgi:hypothetical protein